MDAQVFKLPDLGEGLTEAEIVRWLVAEGDTVVVDQAVVEVETAKSIVEVPTPYAGRVATLHATEGSTVDVGKPLITIGPAGEQAGTSGEAETYREEEKAGSGAVLIGYGTSEPAAAGRRRRPRAAAAAAPAPQPTAPQPTAPQPTAPQPTAPEPAVARTQPRVASPIVRQLAKKHGVDVTRLEGSGREGLVVRRDVEAAIAQRDEPGRQEARPEARGERRVPLNGFRKAVSAALSRSRAEIPEATVWVDVDATALVELREAGRRPNDPGPGLMAYLARFVVAALREHPVLNSRLDTERDEIVEYDHVNLGIAVQTDRGLVVPAVLDAHTMTTAGLGEALGELTSRAREGRLSQEELTAGTFTLNNYGAFNVDGSAAIINHPQVAILGLGRIIDRAWVVDGEITIRKIAQMSFVFDHRVCDGGTAAGFMRSVADAIENPVSAIARL